MKIAARPERVFAVVVFIAIIAALFAYPSLSPSSQSDIGTSALNTTIQTSPTTTTVASPVPRSLWVGEENTVIAISLSDGQPGLYITTSNLEDIAVDNGRGNIWIGTKTAIIQYKQDGTQNFQYPLNLTAASSATINNQSKTTKNNITTTCTDDSNTRIRLSLDPSDGSVWIGAGNEVIKLSSDNHELFRIAGFGSITDVSVDIADGSCWVGQKHKISKYTSDGTALFHVPMGEYISITALAADPVFHTLWVGAEQGLGKIDALGQELFRTEEPVGIRDIAVNPTTGSLWLVTRQEVYKYSKDNQKLLMIPLCPEGYQNEANAEKSKTSGSTSKETTQNTTCEAEFVALAVDSVDNTVWVATKNTLVKGTDIGDVLLQVPGFIQIKALDIGLPKIGVTITEPQDGAEFDTSPITVRGIITDPTTTVDVNGTKATVTNLDFEAKDIILTSGANTITATATNLARQKATDTINVTYNPPDTGPSLLLCVEPFREQTPRPPSEGCTQRITGRIYALVTGLLDETAVTVTLNNVLLPEGVHIYNQGDIMSGSRQGTFFWAFVRLPVADGPVLYTAIATDAQGGRSSAIVTVIKDTTAPNVFITSPPEGTITNSQTITITGTVDDPTAELRFNWSGATIPVVNGVFSVPYDLGAADGLRYITITARDPIENPSAAYLTVTRDATPPQISVSAPADGVIVHSQNISVAGTVSDQNLSAVTVSINSGQPQPLTVSGTSFSGSASLTSGSNTLLFAARDRAGNISTITRIVTLDADPPTAAIISPSPNAELTGITTISVTATDALSGVQSVTLLVEGRFIASLTQPPFTFQLDAFALSAGTNTITVRVVDKAGNQTETSMPVTAQKQFGIDITSPASGTTINKATALISGTINMPVGREIGVTVNGTLAEQQGNNFAAIIPLQQGQNTITATATNIYGVQEQAVITINTDNLQEQLRFTVSPASGITMTKPDGTIAFDTIMNVESYLTGTIASYAWDTNGDGAVEQTGATLTQITATYQTPGVYFPTITVTDTMGNMYTETAIVNVLDRTTLDTLLKSKWDGMKGALLAGNIETALNYFIEGAKDNYKNIFTQMGSDKISAVFLNILELKMPALTERVAYCEAIRLENTGRFSYPVDFVKDQNGIWKILGF